METALRQQVFVAGDPQRDQVLRGQARTIYNVCHQTFFSSPQPIDLSVSKSSYWAVRCNDDVATTDLPTWNAFVRSTTLAAPLHTFAAQSTVAELNAPQPKDAHITPAQWDGFKTALAAAQTHDRHTADAIAALLTRAAAAQAALAPTGSTKSAASHAEHSGERLERLLECVEQLPERLRQVVRAQLSSIRIERVARDMKTSAGAIYTMQWRANRLLRQCMEKAL